MSERTEALLKKAHAVHLAGRPGDAFKAYTGILRSDPYNFYALQLAGLAACQIGRLGDAVELFRRAYRINSRSGPTLMYLGSAYADLGRDTEAAESLKAALALDPENADIWLINGSFNLARRRNAEALSCYVQALKLKPGNSAALKGIGDVRQVEGHAAQAVESYRAALEFNPANTEARLGLVQMLLSCNRIGEALAECERVVKEHPENIQAQSHRLFLLNYLAGVTTERLSSEHSKFNGLFPAPPVRAFANAREPTKRLRVAFLSQDLRTHSVAYFLEPIIANLDAAKFEVILYHDHMSVDAVSERFRSHAALWRNFSGRPNAIVEAAIRSDAPDVIVDLAGHSGVNRLQLFARRLAPVQITYLGYPNTSGLQAMDYRFTDEVADPQGDADRMNVERLVRFSTCAWAYSPSPETYVSGQTAAAGSRDVVSFGSFNNLAKVNEPTLRLWAEVLEAVPGSRLVLKGLAIDPERMMPLLRQAGIAADRVQMLRPAPDQASHLKCYNQVDIALDPFPYGGTTTTCEALWMGRPVVTLAGDRHSSRVGASLLSAIGKPQWIAKSPRDYVRIAAGLAANRQALRSDSEGLRYALCCSALLDHRGQARRFGEAVRRCWESWCSRDGDREALGNEQGGRSPPKPELASV